MHTYMDICPIQYYLWFNYFATKLQWMFIKCKVKVLIGTLTGLIVLKDYYKIYDITFLKV